MKIEKYLTRNCSESCKKPVAKLIRKRNWFCYAIILELNLICRNRARNEDCTRDNRNPTNGKTRPYENTNKKSNSETTIYTSCLL